MQRLIRSPRRTGLKHHASAFAALAVGMLMLPATVLADDMRNIARSGELEICVSPRAMPLSDLEEQTAGRPPGLQIEIGQELAKRLNVSLKTSWLSYRYHAKHTNCDAFVGVARLKNQPDNPYLKKTIPFFKVELLLATRQGTTINGLDDLKDKRVAVDNGSVIHDVLRKNNIEVFVSYTSDEKKLNALTNNEVDVALVSNLGLGWYRKNHDDADFHITSSKAIAETYEYDYALGLRRADRMTARDFNDLITAMIEDGTLKKIFESYGVTYTVNKWQGEYYR